MDLLEFNELPDWFRYPEELRRIAQWRVDSIGPWRFLQGDNLRTRFYGIRDRYPARDVVPFCASGACDDVACWEADKGPRVVVIHDFASPGLESVGEYPDFWTWFRAIVDEAIERETRT
ncbi:MAG: hypothetical protein IPK64_18095 [bacterium]|nr:hypothetical protein [bacterium]